eukprot:7922608-Alexandrium_andersonii.AAC.1
MLVGERPASQGSRRAISCQAALRMFSSRMGSWCSRDRPSSRPLAAAALAAVPGGSAGGSD